ncbi:ornithine cyclodeaminase [Rhizobium sp. NXC24]|uniref:ornithine cyclodeaminase family protein n=1 Tax=Rhizobium sp. NXC24 TaxID=2048897 RepID=UPI001FE1798E|nr:ornithine cyclodeaminase [Rhizobium sp. NXC24]
MLNRTAYIPGLGYAVKAETTLPSNVTQGLPAIQGAVLLFDAETGSVRAVIDSKLVTEFKTAADSILAAQLLARPDSRHLLIVGAGVVAASLAKAYKSVFPGLERISIWARRFEQSKGLVSSLGDIPVELEPVEDLAAAVERADIVSTATGSEEPLVLGDWVCPGTHIDLIGAFTPDMRESDDALMAKGTIYVDFRDTTIDRTGDLMQPIATGAITREDVRGDLYDLVHYSSTARLAENEITVYKNGGGAHLDLMIASYIANMFAEAVTA